MDDLHDSAFKSRLKISILFAIAIAICCLLITWLYGGAYATRHVRYTLGILRDTDRAIVIYRQKTGHLPNTLPDLVAISDLIHLYQIDGVFNDVWNNPLIYEMRGKQCTLLSYGWDGKRGGTGLNADILSESNSRITAPFPFWQVITYPTSQDMVGMSLLSGLLALVVCYVTIKPNDLQRNYRVDLVFKLGTIFVVTLVLAAIMTILQVPPSP